jgi:hypothetical protein
MKKLFEWSATTAKLLLKAKYYAVIFLQLSKQSL